VAAIANIGYPAQTGENFRDRYDSLGVEMSWRHERYSFQVKAVIQSSLIQDNRSVGPDP
jgi:hypothetical protein